MRSVDGLGAAPVVARVERSGFTESVHCGLAVITAADGTVEYALGDARTPILPRSASKPLQAVAALRAGAGLRGEHLALACASHSGEAFHLAGVREMLAAAGLTEADLANTPALPLGEAARNAAIAAGVAPASISQDCSGKHAAMLAACVASGWPTDGYLAPEHPLQQLMAATIAELAGEPVVATTVDGCGAPQHAYPIVGLARAFGRLAAAASGAELRVADAMRAHPEYVGGTGRDVTALMRGAPGVIAKDGAEAVYAVGLRDGRGLAVKIADGSARARAVVMGALLRRAGAVSDDVVGQLSDAPVLGHGRPVGAVVATC